MTLISKSTATRVVIKATGPTNTHSYTSLHLRWRDAEQVNKSQSQIRCLFDGTGRTHRSRTFGSMQKKKRLPSLCNARQKKLTNHATAIDLGAAPLYSMALWRRCRLTDGNTTAPSRLWCLFHVQSGGTFIFQPLFTAFLHLPTDLPTHPRLESSFLSYLLEEITNGQASEIPT